MSINSNSTNLQLDTKRHSFAHLMAAAVGQMFPEVQYGVGPVIENGCYYDFVLPRNLIPEDLVLLEGHLKEMLKAHLSFKVQELDIDEAISHFDRANQPLKVELLMDLKTKGTTSMSEEEKADFADVKNITLYRIVNESTGEILFEDLCKGPHIAHVKEIKNIGFKLDKFSAAYWRGDQARGINMQRLYALVYDTKEELESFTNLREEAKKRDHRVLGSSLKLFTISELVGSGFPLFQPKGAIVRKLLEDYLWQLQKHSHQRVYTPHLTKQDLYDVSGHSGKYLDDMFSVYGGTSKETFYVKPMNCPMHMQIFDDNQFSYKDMPVRYFDPTTVYRDEKTGQLSGLTRVRSITQDDGHIFCRVPQIQDEFTAIVHTIREFYGSLGMTPDWVSWSVRDSATPDKYLGDPANWDIAEEAIRKAAEVNNLTYKRCEGEAAFYGPKLDFMFKDCIGREWQLSTIQCDFVQPERFNLSFVNENSEKERPVVIHRAISGSLERFMGILIEHFAGKFPFWLAPEQIRILTINDEVLPFVDKIKAELDKAVLMQPLKYNELRYSVDERMESLGKKIRDSKLEKIPMFIVVGPKDMEDEIVSIEYNGESVKVPLAEVKVWMEGVNN
jgi:threonyl-tRNA synthetase